MQEKEAGPILKFKNTAIDKEGNTVIEERVVSGCTADELMNYLNVPWENYSDVSPEEKKAIAQTRAREFAEILTDQFQQLNFVISGNKKRGNKKQISIRCLPVEDKYFQEEDVQSKKGRKKAASRLKSNVNVMVFSEDEQNEVGYSKNSNIIDIKNNGLMVINKENLYAVVNVHFNLAVEI